MSKLHSKFAVQTKKIQRGNFWGGTCPPCSPFPTPLWSVVSSCVDCPISWNPVVQMRWINSKLRRGPNVERVWYRPVSTAIKQSLHRFVIIALTRRGLHRAGHMKCYSSSVSVGSHAASFKRPLLSVDIVCLSVWVTMSASATWG